VENAKGKVEIILKKRKRKTKVVKLVGSIFFLAIMIFILGTQIHGKIIYKGAAHIIHSRLNKASNSSNSDSIPRKEGNLDNIALDSLGSGNYPVREEEGILNFLFIGIEKMHGARNTDCMMLVTLDTKNKIFKLTSLMRDSYVSIPGYHDNKLNSAYAKGGINLLADTIEKNYKIKLSGYISVDFESFEKVIDLLGGVTIKLSKEEAYYLNTKSYISNPKYRNVVEGTNLLNGNQALGYCRVRYVKTIENEANDYGRTSRQRKVMNEIFEKYKSLSVMKLISISDKCLNYVNTDLSEATIELIIETGSENRMSAMESFRMPVKEAFEDPKIYEGVSYPLVYNWEENVKQLYTFLYGDTEEEAIAQLKKLQ